MLKTVGVLVAGAFAGAVVMEVVHKKYRGHLDKFYSKAGNLAADMKEGFKKGYRSLKKPATPAEA